jgi:endonuclease YncB( thermonuclease family)
VIFGGQFRLTTSRTTEGKHLYEDGSIRARGREIERKVLAAILAAIVVVAVAVVYVTAFQGPKCRGVASCLSADVEHIVDGDTLDIGGVRVRLALVNSPEVGQPGYSEATQFTAQTCPIGSRALVDEDDGQTGGSYGRMVALVYCGSVNLNAELLRTGHAVLLADFCSVSEFARDSWAGCP